MKSDLGLTVHFPWINLKRVAYWIETYKNFLKPCHSFRTQKTTEGSGKDPSVHFYYLP